MKLLSLFSFLSVASAASLSTRGGSAPTIKGNGVSYVGVENTQYGVDEWLGIRYSKSPTGSLRLQPPVPFVNTGTVKAQAFGSRCFGLDDSITASEDCLFLNIYRPTLKYGQQATKLPVLVWIHGGGFNTGAGSLYKSESLAQTSLELDTPTIIVTINYRLSFFGFSAGSAAAANNALNLGLLDQRQALKWVNQNIHLWGGDPTAVTLFGQSAGATSIGLHITAYGGTTDGLFRAAILESGSAADTAPTPPPTFPSFQLGWDLVAKAVGCATATNVFKCVQAAPYAAIAAAVTQIGDAAPLSDGDFPWQPVVDGHFIQDFPSKLLFEGKFAHIPVIIGYTTDEVTYVIPETLNINSETTILGIFQEVLPFVSLATAEEILALDPLSASPNPSGVGGTQWKRAANIASDIFERCPGLAFARNVSLHSQIWKYRWNAIIPAEFNIDPVQGVVHASELPYVFGPSITPFITTPADLALSKTVQKGWISFAAYLNPNRLGDLAVGSHGEGLRWPKFRRTTTEVLVFQTAGGGPQVVPGQGKGLLVEKDGDVRPECEFIISKDLEFVR